MTRAQTHGSLGSADHRACRRRRAGISSPRL